MRSGRRYRNRLEIIMDILSVAGQGAKKTQIMYQANLSYKLLCKYLAQVQNVGLVKLDGADSYKVTGEGRDFLNRLNEYFKNFEKIENHLSELDQEEMILKKMVGADIECSGNRRVRID